MPLSDYISDFRNKLSMLMNLEAIIEFDSEIAGLVDRNYKNPMDWQYDDEFCAEIGYRIHHEEAKEWFSD